MNLDKLQRQRFEFKYRVSEHKAQVMRPFIESFLNIDAYGVLQSDLSYPVHSIYLDSPSLKTYTDTLNGNRNRYKMRVRYYENGDDTPVYLEIKRRYDKVIAKKRAIVYREAVQRILDGAFASPDFLVDPSPDQIEALEYFCNIRTRLDAQPKTHIAYRREAYENDNNNAVRVTFDRQVVTEAIPARPLEFRTITDNPVSVFGSEVILELKFTNRFPAWFKDVVQSYGLRQESAAKYVDGLIRLHQNHQFSLNYW
ncbi:MAG: polyphosphate polymerase domain-containing protein [Bacteroidetes bacterium]|nr:polyphosphate polymerase domain-containing protein [Bacteroidota bacterium]MCH8523296.1 polyphosphate polymerase domain-containing protein [Balneolales bacterium]